jgi:acetyltransferase-like isoleucine patch superfamily enzyme
MRVAAALAKGHWYRLWYGICRKRFAAGRNLRVFGKIVLRGPGAVVFGDDVVIHGRLTPWTHSRDAKIRVGSRTSLDGVRFGCAKSITIGDRCTLATCEILDTDFHSTRADRHHNSDAPVRVSPVVVEDNVWIAAQAALLPGTVIGRNSVVGYGAICVQAYPESSIIFGNPARKVAPVLAGPSGELAQ